MGHWEGFEASWKAGEGGGHKGVSSAGVDGRKRKPCAGAASVRGNRNGGKVCSGKQPPKDLSGSLTGGEVRTRGSQESDLERPNSELHCRDWSRGLFHLAPRHLH